MTLAMWWAFRVIGLSTAIIASIWVVTWIITVFMDRSIDKLERQVAENDVTGTPNDMTEPTGAERYLARRLEDPEYRQAYEREIEDENNRGSNDGA